jgi:hypothetical protein
MGGMGQRIKGRFMDSDLESLRLTKATLCLSDIGYVHLFWFEQFYV